MKDTENLVGRFSHGIFQGVKLEGNRTEGLMETPETPDPQQKRDRKRTVGRKEDWVWPQISRPPATPLPTPQSPRLVPHLK